MDNSTKATESNDKGNKNLDDEGAEEMAETTAAIITAISDKYCNRDEEDAALKKQRTEAWSSSFKDVVDEYQSSDSSQSSMEDDNKLWKEDKSDKVSLQDPWVASENQSSLEHPPADQGQRNSYQNTDARIVPSGLSPQVSDPTIQMGAIEDKQPYNVPMDAVLVDERQGIRGSPQEAVTAIPMSDYDRSPSGICWIFRNRRVGFLFVLFVIFLASLAAGLSLLFLSDDINSDNEPTLIPSSVSDNVSFIPTSAPTVSLDMLVDLLRDSVEDVTPWDNRTTPQYKALFWLANEDEWTSAIIEDGSLTIPIQIMVERYVLVVLYMALSGSLWIEETRMLNVTAASCDWFVESSYDENNTCLVYCQPTGVQCSGQFVSGLSLVGVDAVGEIPTEVGLLSSLEYFLLNFNYIDGTIPSEVFRLPKLEALELYVNELTGSIPSEAGLAADLQTLNLGFNLITGTLDNVANPSLQSLSLEGNKLQGTIPINFGTMTMLDFLTLGWNNLSGPLPSSLANLQNLKVLLLSNNTELTGPVPSTLSSLDLSELYLDGTGLTNVGEAFCAGETFPLVIADCGGTVPKTQCSCCWRCCENGSDCFSD
eukprot:scaffold328_cov130-Cylindrotheca_fusiformis.AAC.9